MYLSKDSKLFLDEMIAMEPDLLNGYCSVIKLFENIKDYDGDYASARGVMDSLAKKELIKYGDKDRSNFRLLEDGRAYEELEGLERKEKAITFLVGIASGVIIGFLLFYFGWS